MANRATRSKFHKANNKLKPFSKMDVIKTIVYAVGIGLAVAYVLYRNSTEYKKFASYLDVKLDDIKESNKPISEMEKDELMELLIRVTAEKNFYDAEILQKIINAK